MPGKVGMTTVFGLEGAMGGDGNHLINRLTSVMGFIQVEEGLDLSLDLVGGVN